MLPTPTAADNTAVAVAAKAGTPHRGSVCLSGGQQLMSSSAGVLAVAHCFVWRRRQRLRVQQWRVVKRDDAWRSCQWGLWVCCGCALQSFEMSEVLSVRDLGRLILCVTVQQQQQSCFADETSLLG